MKYPNLELIEKTFKEKVGEKYPDIFNKTDERFHIYTADMFSQIWSNTATGFDLEPLYSGQAFTNEYTTVMRLDYLIPINNNAFVPKLLYGVFFGNRLAYILRNPNQKFEFDLRDRQMKSQKNARKYVDDEFREYRELLY